MPASGSSPRLPPTDTTVSTPMRIASPPPTNAACGVRGARLASASRHTRTIAASTAPAPATSPHWPTRLASARSVSRSGRYCARRPRRGSSVRPNHVPEPTAMCACRTAQPEPVGDSCAPTRKVPSRSTWYGRSRPITSGAETAAPASSGSRNRRGTRPMTSMDPARTASRVVVLRSGCAKVSAIGTTDSSTASEKRCHAGRLEPRTAARTSSSPSLASSEGWKLTGPIPIQRVAPFADRPTARTATRSSTAAP